MFRARRAWAVGVSGIAAVGLVMAQQQQQRQRRAFAKERDFSAELAAAQTQPVVKMPQVNPMRVNRHGTGEFAMGSHPVFTRDEVSRHDGTQLNTDGKPSVWVTYKNNVYDVSDFIVIHPGGQNFILQAAGGAVDGFWDYWSYHYVSAKVEGVLNRFFIGILDEEFDSADSTTDVYVDEPVRPKTQIPLLDKPWSSETTVETLAAHPLTPIDAFYVRNHTPVPVLDAQSHTICMGTIEKDGRDMSIKSFTIEDLKKKYGEKRIISVLQCAGNRGGEMMDLGTTAFNGSPYFDIGPGMIGCAEWKGVPLAKVLKDVVPEISSPEYAHKHVIFEGADGYVASTSLKRVLDETADVLIATEMNGQPLLPDHGYPARVLVPGNVGARSVKWINRVRIADTEADSCWNSVYYKHGDGTSSLTGMPIQSLILSPTRDQAVNTNANGTVKVMGIAWAGETGNAIHRVEVSSDSSTWHTATLRHSDIPDDQSSRHWRWVRWECDVPVSEATPTPLIQCRAFDSEGNTQPERPWNPKGYLYNGWHRVNIYLNGFANKGATGA